MGCMFCGSEENLTREHVFPAFMGGKLEVPDGSCKRCNGDFAKVEAELKANTALLLNMFGIRNRDGVIPNAKVAIGIPGSDVEGLSGYRIGESGEIVLSEKVVDVFDAHGRPMRRGIFTTEASAEKFIAKSKGRGDQVIERPVPEDLTLGASFQFSLPFCLGFETRKVVAKIAIASIAYELGMPVALSSDFDRLRNAREATTVQELAPVAFFCNEDFMGAYARTVQQHSVMCYLSAGTKKGWVLITLFGALTYVVEVTENYNGRESKSFSIFYDAAQQKRFRPVVLADEQSLVRKVLSKATKFENRQAIDDQWHPVMAAYCDGAGIPLKRTRLGGA
jgi:hypothetical protein